MVHETGRDPYVTARLYVISTRGGCLRSGRPSGYRGHWIFRDAEGVDTGHDGAVVLPGGQRMEPGESRSVKICPLVERYGEDLTEGDVIEMWDSGPVGVAIITEPLVTP